MATPWYTSTDLISAVKRKMSFPISEQTFSEDDILKFASEEMMISQVPSVLEFHEEYYVTYAKYKIVPYQNRYAIPDRAIGMRLRDVFWSDDQPQLGQDFGNLFEMTRIMADDKSFFQRNVGANQQISKFYIEGDTVVLVPFVTAQVTGSLLLFYYLRPNQLVTNDRAATITNFQQTLVVNNALLSNGDQFFIAPYIGLTGTTYLPTGNPANESNLPGEPPSQLSTTLFTAISSGIPVGNQFLIGATSTDTAFNLAAAITAAGLGVTANNGTPNSATVYINFNNIKLGFVSNTLGIVVPLTMNIMFSGGIPANITNSSLVDFMQTKGGHKILNFDVLIPDNSVSATQITFNTVDVPRALSIGDYVCSQYECIIPQIPDDLHNGLAERTCARILEALGDAQGLSMAQAKIADIDKRQGNIVGDRVEGSPPKVMARHSMLRRGGMGSRRRL